jgi:hypothetical protein
MDLHPKAALGKDFELQESSRQTTLATVFEDHIKHVEDNSEIADEQSAAQEGDTTKELAHLKGQKQSS